jgi:DNA-directed RNA polymerase specialized sigma24 family protein
LTFFGLQADYRKELFEEIDFLVRGSSGAYSFTETYNMPIWLRRFYVNKIIDEYEKKQKKQEEIEGTTRFELPPIKDKIPKQAYKPSGK